MPSDQLNRFDRFRLLFVFLLLFLFVRLLVAGFASALSCRLSSLIIFFRRLLFLVALRFEREASSAFSVTAKTPRRGE